MTKGRGLNYRHICMHVVALSCLSHCARSFHHRTATATAHMADEEMCELTSHTGGYRHSTVARRDCALLHVMLGTSFVFFPYSPWSWQDQDLLPVIFCLMSLPLRLNGSTDDSNVSAAGSWGFENSGTDMCICRFISLQKS